MERVRPIKNMRDINRLLERLGEWDEKYRMLFLIGINTGLRIGDLVPLRVRDVKNDYITKEEGKTGRRMRVLINKELRVEIDDYIELKPNDRVLFPSRNGSNKPIGRARAYQVLKLAALEIGMENIGTHTLRKTFAYHTYKKTKDLALVMRCLNHKDAGTTLLYLGLDQPEMDGAMECGALHDEQAPELPRPTAKETSIPTESELIKAIDRLTAAIEKHGAGGLVNR